MDHAHRDKVAHLKTSFSEHRLRENFIAEARHSLELPASCNRLQMTATPPTKATIDALSSQ
jgi:hypothetical protein